MNQESENRILTHLLRAFGAWSDQVVFCGPYALTIYQLLSKQRLISIPASTISLAINPWRSHLSDPISLHIRLRGAFRFKEYTEGKKNIGGIDNQKHYLTTEVEGKTIRLTFLTHMSTNLYGTYIKRVSGLPAMALEHIDLCYQNPLPFSTSQGASGCVISPSAWLVHTGLTFPLRQDGLDLWGIYFLATQMGSISEQALQGLSSFANLLPAVRQNLTQWTAKASATTWGNLRRLDPTKTLTESSFKALIHKIYR